MTRTHHATRTFKLTCGCLRDYPGMPAAMTHEVLCPVCWCAAETVYAYPDRACGLRLGGSQCTNEPGNKSCQAGVHHDSFTKTEFRFASQLRKSDEGTTHKA